MRGSRRHSIVRWALAATLGAAGPVLAQGSIGFVSLDRILREAPAAQRAQKKLEQEFSQRGQELSKLAEQLKKMQENLEKNAVTMSETERQKREEFESVIERANRAVKQIAEAEKLDVVFQNEQVVWANPRIDITDKVIKALDDTRAGK
jgi:outer membrane protein